MTYPCLICDQEHSPHCKDIRIIDGIRTFIGYTSDEYMDYLRQETAQRSAWASPATVPAQATCPHRILRISPRGYVRGALCGKPGDHHRWCEDHALSHEFLECGSTLGYPALDLNEDRSIGEGAANWECYAETMDRKHLARDIRAIITKEAKPTPKIKTRSVREPCEALHTDYWEALSARIRARAEREGRDYDEEMANTTRHLLQLSIPPRLYLAPFLAYGQKEDSTFGQVGMHGCFPSEYWTMEEWQQRGEIP